MRLDRRDGAFMIRRTNENPRKRPIGDKVTWPLPAS
ncbi:hypothetical protein FHS49_000409 [Sphingobium boeckii]|uniref:Uncharacterized protein n=1 Tax=Sphingobium boeckii TaxID=1082345 RepID=A0A7W9AF36_9SPHN|nr:hypothetical protein [Sphingobium boeckii]